VRRRKEYMAERIRNGKEILEKKGKRLPHIKFYG
jgi:hypothetical protein